MPQVSHSIVIERSPTQIFSVLSDILHYPAFFPQVKKVEALSSHAGKLDVSFVIDLMQPIACVLQFSLEAPYCLSWTLVESELLKANTGSWKLEELEPNICEVTYTTEVELAIWIPDAILEALIKLHVPEMMKALQREVEKRYAR